MELLGSGCTGIFRTNHTEALISENADRGGHTLVGHYTGDDHGIDPHIVEDLCVVCSKADAVCGLIYNDLVFERGKRGKTFGEISERKAGSRDKGPGCEDPGGSR